MANIKPLAQGALVQLCGVYAIINCVRISTHGKCAISNDDCQGLFNAIVEDLNQKDCLADVIRYGIGFNLQCQMLRLADDWLYLKKKWRLQYHRPWYRKSSIPEMPVIYNEINTHLNQPNTSALTLIAGPSLSHWTVIKSINCNRVALFDSLGYNGYSINNKSESYEIVPKGTYLITCSPE